MTTTTAAVHDRYGADAVEIREVPLATPGEGQVLVEVRASSLNPVDWHSLTGTPWIARLSLGLRVRTTRRIGTDVAGTVLAVGPGVDGFAVGDHVFGAADGALAGAVVAKATSLVHKPDHVAFEAAGAVAVAAVTALQALRDKGGVTQGSRVLVNGAAGGVGTMAVQIATAMGATVTGVCSTANVAMVRELGAGDVVDYTRDRFTDRPDRYDVILDNQGNTSARALRRVLVPGGVEVIVGGPKRGRLLGPVSAMIRLRSGFLLGGRRATSMLAKINRNDLAVLADMLAEGTLRPVVSQTVPLAEVAAAFQQLAAGHTRGKIVVVP